MDSSIVARVTSEHGRLRRVLVHTPGKERLALQAWATPGQRPAAVAQLAEIRAEHARIKAVLREALGAEAVLELTDLLGAIFTADVSRRERILAEILGASTPEFIAEIEASGRSLHDVEPRRIVEALVVDSSPSLLWVRDPAVSTPAGIVLHEMAQPHRGREPALLRAILRHHPLFAAGSLPVDLTDGTGTFTGSDAPVEWNLLDGGNTVVLGSSALVIGAPGPGAFETFALEPWVRRLLLADTGPRLECIYLVTVPAPFGHLDAVLNPFAPRAALAMPYLFGGPALLSREDVRRGLREFRRLARATGKVDPRPDRLSWRDFDDAGQVEIFSRDPASVGGIHRRPGRHGFLQQLTEDGWLEPDKIAWIGGRLEDHESPANHLACALQEQSRQAGNVLALGPHDVVIADDNPRTRAALERTMATAGRPLRLQSVTMDALAACYGGIRCLTLPLQREDA